MSITSFLFERSLILSVIQFAYQSSSLISFLIAKPSNVMQKDWVFSTVPKFSGIWKVNGLNGACLVLSLLLNQMVTEIIITLLSASSLNLFLFILVWIWYRAFASWTLLLCGSGASTDTGRVYFGIWKSTDLMNWDIDDLNEGFSALTNTVHSLVFTFWS